ncbi:heat stress transcription factor A-8 [Ziziphus jujuba]|uniref:Heat stress transcription factor A-8 n=1 Tax=Ziziphus jujuba TaxID=326968 RepID=A0A6P4ARP3_ZIZJJ|nr:heat stress transcription factor A-8 [Ziziphus jujuba]
MVKSVDKKGNNNDGSESLGSVAPFLRKCYEMVDDEATNSIISWNETNDCFVIWDMTQFSVQLLPKYFKHSNFSSFMRQLNIYGFRKVDTDRWVFANDGFIRGKKYLLKNIVRRKHPQSLDQRKTSQPKETPDEQCEKIEDGLWKEVENLKIDKNALMQELVKLRQHQETADNKLLLLRDRIQGMEKNQQQLLSFLVMAMQSPGFLVQLLHPKENNWRLAEADNMLEQDDKSVSSDAMIVRYQPPVDETSQPVCTPTSGADTTPESDPFPDGIQDFFMNSDFMKILMDEKLCSLESHAPFILPDLSDDCSWEQLLLASPSLENSEFTKHEGKEHVDSEMEVELTGPGIALENFQSFDSLIKEMEKSQNLELQTEKIDLLSSNNKCGTPTEA